MKALQIDNLIKKYNQNLVLDNVNLDINKWDFFGLLGYNWAGKTTLISILTDLTRKTSWDINIFEYNIDNNFLKAKKKIWVVPQEYNFDIFAKVEEIPILQWGFYGIPHSVAKERTKYYLKKLDLWDKKDKRVRELSGGMKRRLMIVRALIHQPELLILDEPTAWVDVELRQSMRDFLQELNINGTTILLTTHYLEEAETLCNKIAILQEWKIIEQSTTKDLLSRLEQECFVLDLETPINKIPEELKDFSVSINHKYEIEVYLKKQHTLNNLFSILEKHNIKVLSMKNKSNRLEQLFLRLTKNK